MKPRVHRMLSRSYWVPPPPHPQASVASSPFGSKGGDTLTCGGGGVGTQFRRRELNVIFTVNRVYRLEIQ